MSLLVDRVHATPVLTPIASVEGEPSYWFLGEQDVSIAPDLNGDGYDEVVYQGWGLVRIHYGGPTGLSAIPDQEWFGDLAVGSPGAGLYDGRVDLHFGSPSGVFETPDFTLRGAGGEQLGTEITSGDLDGDGLQDLVVASRSAPFGRVSVYPGSVLGLAAVPSLRIDGAVDSAFGTSLATGDVNGDGYAEVVVGAPETGVGRGHVHVHLGTSAGLDPLGTSLTRSSGDVWTQTGRVVTTTDWNGDGYDDVLATVFGEEILVWDGSATSVADPPRQLRANNGAGATSIAGLGDVDGDGFGDLLSSPESYGDADVILGGALGVTVSPLPPASDAYWTGGGGDLNGDGLRDLVFSDSVSVSHVLGDAGRTWVELGNWTGQVLSDDYTNVAALGDVNADGFEDVAVVRGDGVDAYLGTALGFDPVPAMTWSAPAYGATGYGVAAGDVNGDGLSDVVVTVLVYGVTGRIEVYFGDSAGPRAVPDQSWNGIVGINLSPVFPTVSDTNGDGFADLSLGSMRYPDLYLHLGSASGLSTAPDDTRTFADVDCTEARPAWGDFDGDGYQDLAVGSTGGVWIPVPTCLDVYLGGAAGLAAAPVVSVRGAADGNRPGVRPTALGDLDGDGDEELLIAEPATNDGAGLITFVPGSPAGPDFAAANAIDGPHPGAEAGASVTLGDYDADGATDLVVGVPGAGVDWSGEAWVFAAVTPSATAPDFVVQSEAEDRLAAFSATADLDGNSVDELLLGSSEFHAWGGRVVVFADDLLPIAVVGGPLETTEAGVQDAFTVVLRVAPMADVTIALSSSPTAEATVAPASLTFGPGDWDVPQTVVVTGVDDRRVDGNVSFTVVVDPAVSADPRFAGVDGADVLGTNHDNDLAGEVIAVGAEALETTEAGGADSFTLVLMRAPAEPVTIPIGTDRPDEVVLSVASVTFGPLDWDVPQVVELVGVDDDAIDGDAPFAVWLGPLTSADPAWDGVEVPDAGGTNRDDDVAGLLLAPEGGLLVSEGGSSDTFRVALRSAPATPVTLRFASSDPTEATSAPAALTFTAETWDEPQVVTVTGVDDDELDGVVRFTVDLVAMSGDPTYADLTTPGVDGATTDDEGAGFVIAPTTLEIFESGPYATFALHLSTRPVADVTIGVRSSDTSEGTVSPSEVTFTEADWASPQRVTVAGVDDDEVDGDQVFAITFEVSSGDPTYAGLVPTEVSVTNADNDAAGKGGTCGCATGRPTLAWGVLALAAVVRRRRR